MGRLVSQFISILEIYYQLHCKLGASWLASCRPACKAHTKFTFSYTQRENKARKVILVWIKATVGSQLAKRQSSKKDTGMWIA